MKVWEDIEKRWSEPDPEEEKEYGPKKKNAREKLFEVREVERDSSFLRRYLTEGLIRELNLFEYKSRGNEKVISRVADEDSWQGIKDTLIQNVGTGTIPVIRIEDADYSKTGLFFNTATMGATSSSSTLKRPFNICGSCGTGGRSRNHHQRKKSSCVFPTTS
jgi:spore cortex formation protein SpoVR/YcgB (stage V sporulation)